jgi:hypothetical protein
MIPFSANSMERVGERPEARKAAERHRGGIAKGTIGWRAKLDR